jgi:hypothetical protein
MLDIVENRIKELKTIIENTPIGKSFTAQARLVEAQNILTLLRQSNCQDQKANEQK